MANYTNIECDGVYENIPDTGNIYFTSLNEYYSNNYNRTENCIQYVTELKSRVQVLEGLVGIHTKVTVTTKKSNRKRRHTSFTSKSNFKNFFRADPNTDDSFLMPNGDCNVECSSYHWPCVKCCLSLPER